LKYTGTKRFGLDGAESLVPAMEQIIKRGGQLGVREIVLGMPHRGRLNILANVMFKPYRAMFAEFQGNPAHPEDVQGSGDVKYHLGTSSDREFDGNQVHLSLTANPSHLEAVNPLVIGKTRAKQSQLNDEDSRSVVLPLLLHGDAAFAGQGLVAECFGLSELKGYRIGGTVHFIVNNQIGFTTSPHYSRSSPYPSDVAKMVQAPIFHVNGDDPEAVVHCAKVATEFRQQFHRDVVIDMFCYRRHGHNEGDEPAFTQPLMYRKIAQHPTTRQIYGKRLVGEGLLKEQEVEGMADGFRAKLDQEFEGAENYKVNKADWLDGKWKGLEVARTGARRGHTSVELDELKAIGDALTREPDDVALHRTIKRMLGNRRRMIETGEGIDWATAESLAFGSLLAEGFPVRLSGQDSGRGTFSQRHSVLVDQATENRYVPLNHIRDGQARYEVIDSMLSEAAVLGFEYGYTMAEPRALVLWEAQFGDFANGAQVIIDQFVASAESKWLRMSGLVMLLPHGYEGQGPEHSSARLERYLQLCGEDNMQVANCTTPANYFHILRRQIHRKFRKPLIIMTPKSLLRHKLAVSTLDDMSNGSTFHRVLYDNEVVCPDKDVRKVVLCTGKVYYDLKEERDKRGIKDVFFLRLEQLYPFPEEALSEELSRFKNLKKVVWCQEEPKNMGAWTFVAPRIEEVLDNIECPAERPIFTGRPEAASPATGLFANHVAEQAALVDEALTC
jgi:2-oxoglutarate dehydrogenase E1 component